MKRISFPANYLKALNFLSATKDPRFYLHSICVRREYLTATNGRILGLIKLNEPLHDLGEEALIIPNETIKWIIKKSRSKIATADAIVEWDEEQAKLTVGSSVELFVPIDHSYPDPSRILPKDNTSNPYPSFNWDYLASFQKVARVISTDSVVHLFPNGQGPARVEIPGCVNFKGVLMPQSH